MTLWLPSSLFVASGGWKFSAVWVSFYNRHP